MIKDNLVIGYDKDEKGSALVVLRPKDPQNSMEYEEVFVCKNKEADLLYSSLCGK